MTKKTSVRIPRVGLLLLRKYSSLNSIDISLLLTNHKFMHLKVDHQKMFAHGDIHTNNIQSFWATLKRGVYGIYHHISVKYMQDMSMGSVLDITTAKKICLKWLVLSIIFCKIGIATW